QQKVAWMRDSLLVEAQRRGVPVYAVAFSEQADFMLIHDLAEATGGGYYRAVSGDEVQADFGRIVDDLKAKVAPAAAAPAPSRPAEPAEPAATPGATTGWIVAGIAVASLVALLVLAVGVRRLRA